jgi:hypothetical protein
MHMQEQNQDFIEQQNEQINNELAEFEEMSQEESS